MLRHLIALLMHYAFIFAEADIAGRRPPGYSLVRVFPVGDWSPSSGSGEDSRMELGV